MRKKLILCECWVDQTIVQFCGFERINKQAGVSKVVRTLASDLKNDPKAIGVVDYDRNVDLRREVENKGFSIAVEIKELNLALAHHKERIGHQLILLRPYAERWLEFHSKKCGIAPDQFGLPADYDEIKDLVNKKMMLKDFRELNDWYKALARVDEAPFRQISEWLKEAEPPSFNRFGV